jgi:RNA 3'-terminal phosphate cyclase (ATP)
MTTPIEIDGALGEGGGQVLRSSLGLSLVTGRSFRITSIRAKRRKPGLLRQHLTAVEAATAVGGATRRGAEPGSQELFFEPGPIRAGEYHFAVGTAGSATLVLQTVLPALLRADGPSRIVLEGGTHNPWAPPFDFLERVFLPLLERIGHSVRARLVRPGFYPAGGGRFEVEVTPGAGLEPLVLLERGEPVGREARALVANLHEGIAETELNAVRKHLGWTESETLKVLVEGSNGPGNVLLLEMRFEQLTELFASFGEVQLPAKAVAQRAFKELRKYQKSSAPVGRYLADQLLVPLAIAAGGTFRTVEPTQHTTTNAQVVGAFLDTPIEMTKNDRQDWLVTIHPWKGKTP